MYLQLHPRAVCYRKGKEGLSPESKTGSLATFSLRVSSLATSLVLALKKEACTYKRVLPG